MTSTRFIASCFVWMLSYVSFAQTAATPSIVIPRLQVSGNGSVDFDYRGSSGTLSLAPSEMSTMMHSVTDDQQYNVLMAPFETNAVIGFFNYIFYVGQSGKVDYSRLTVVGIPNNEFTDRYTAVPYSVVVDGKTHAGHIFMPVHSFTSKGEISITSEPPSIVTGRSNTLQLHLKSDLPEGLRPCIKAINLTADHKDQWRNVLNSAKPSSLPLAGNHPDFCRNGGMVLNRSSTVTVEAYPDTYNALTNSLFTLKPEDIDEHLRALVVYETEMGGAERNPEPFDVSVRYRPAWYFGFLAVMLGSIIASLVTTAFPASWKQDKWWKTILSGIGLSFICYLLARLLGVTLTIFGFTLNLEQVLPCMGLGIIVGLAGLKTLDAFKIPIPGKAAQ